MRNKEKTLKLYTEGQVREAFFEGINFPKSITPASMGFVDQYVAKKINALKPIELPSDEEIIDEWETQVEQVAYVDGAINGSRWMKEQIIKKANEK